MISAGTKFLLACYGKKYYNTCQSMTDCRLKMWRTKTGSGSNIKLCTLPASSEASTENIKRAHLQTIIWKRDLPGELPPLDKMDCGWEMEGWIVTPNTVPPGTKLAPDEIL